jgi:hypothetical protein
MEEHRTWCETANEATPPLSLKSRSIFVQFSPSRSSDHFWPNIFTKKDLTENEIRLSRDKRETEHCPCGLMLKVVIVNKDDRQIGHTATKVPEASILDRARRKSSGVRRFSDRSSYLRGKCDLH